MNYTIGVDLGGTNLRAASLTETGGLIHQISGTTTLTEGRDRVVGDIVRFIREVRVWSRDAAKRERFAAEHNAVAVASAVNELRTVDLFVGGRPKPNGGAGFEPTGGSPTSPRCRPGPGPTRTARVDVERASSAARLWAYANEAGLQVLRIPDLRKRRDGS